MYKQLILLVGMVLGGLLPTTAQTPAPQLIHAQGRITPILTTAPEPSGGASLLPPENPGKPAAHFNYLLPSVYERDQHPEGLESLAPIREIRSLSLTQSSSPSFNTGEDVRGTMARFISSTCSLFLYPLAVPRILFQRDQHFRVGRFRPLPMTLA
jgi:hypothetical protein